MIQKNTVENKFKNKIRQDVGRSSLVKMDAML
jgi:hypothetical protein